MELKTPFLCSKKKSSNTPTIFDIIIHKHNNKLKIMKHINLNILLLIHLKEIKKLENEKKYFLKKN